MVLSLTPHNLEDVLKDVVRVGRATGELESARKVVAELQSRIDNVKQRCLDSETRPTVFCLEWMDPIYCSGHWMPELVRYAGGREVLGKFGEPSTVVDWRDVVKSDPEVIFVTVCGYDVRRTLKEISALTKRQGWRDLKAVEKGKVYVLDSPSYYSRSGPRLVDGLEIMAYLLHPDLFRDYRPPKHSACSLSSRRFI
jgi:iron complex transport system substrate-binding protein